ncbi:hypothetical protein C1H46_031964 [Malus baccata]|uniref:Uncharacterized protein n=1 Tax=Malus baccata TaxID=106549 RepID=A0A540L862_MALBA|nr:hypothetical protein C1H46_031964 [Malus baccata]
MLSEAVLVSMRGFNGKLLFDKVIDGNKVIDNGEHDLQLLDPVTNGNQFRCALEETLHLDTPNSLLELLHVSLIVLRLDIQKNRGFSTLLLCRRIFGCRQLRLDSYEILSATVGSLPGVS